VFAALGRLVVHRPWRVIVVWIIAAVAIISLAPKLTSTSDESSFLPSHYESIKAQNLQESAFPTAQTPAALIVFERQTVRFRLRIRPRSRLSARL
jgi:RND superfamily putative drug exporter